MAGIKQKKQVMVVCKVQTPILSYSSMLARSQRQTKFEGDEKGGGEQEKNE